MSEKLSDTWLELVSRWRRCFTPDQLVAFIEDVKNARWSDMGPLEAENAELKRLLDPIKDHDRRMLRGVVERLKQSHGESGAVGDMLDSALLLLASRYD